MNNDDNYRPNIDRRPRPSSPNTNISTVNSSNQSSNNKSKSTPFNNGAYSSPSSPPQPIIRPNRNNYGWVICIVSIVVLIIVIVLFKSCIGSEKKQQGNTNSTNSSSVGYAEGVDNFSSVSEDISLNEDNKTSSTFTSFDPSSEQKSMNRPEVSNVESSSNDTSDIDPSVTESSLNENTVSSEINSIVVDPIPEKTLTVKKIPENKTSINNTSTKIISGNITDDNQIIDFSFKSVHEGIYRFEFTEVNDGVYYNLEILNTAYERIKSSSYLNTGEGITVSLDSNKDYIIRVSQYKNYGSFKLLIGIKQAIVDISSYTDVSDDIQYTDQRNTYSFIPSNDGLHRFEYDDVPDGMYLNMAIYNSGWEVLKSGSYMSSGDGLSVKLTKGKLYYIKSEYYKGDGRYSLMIGHKKDSVKLSDYTTVKDSIQYTEQKNEYYFVSSVNGTHRFEFSDVPDGMYLEMEVFNSGWETVKRGSYMSTEDGLTVNLEKDKQYIIQIRQYKNYGNYSFSIGYKKTSFDVSNYSTVSDSIQYTDQKNDYYLVPSVDATYKIELSDVSNAMYLEMEVFNSGWETIKRGSYMSVEDGLTVNLRKDKQYIIQVRQQKGAGTYSFRLCKE